MRWTVRGAWKADGKDASLAVEATSKAQAEKIAAGRGILVESVEPEAVKPVAVASLPPGRAPSTTPVVVAIIFATLTGLAAWFAQQYRVAPHAIPKWEIGEFWDSTAIIGGHTTYMLTGPGFSASGDAEKGETIDSVSRKAETALGGSGSIANRLGQQGWELVAVDRRDHQDQYSVLRERIMYFKRPRQ